MLRRDQRIGRSSQFARAIRGGRRATRGAVVVHFLPGDRQSPQGEGPRCGFVVSKAVGGSVVRHRVIRRLRHICSERLAALPDGSLLVVRARPSAADRPFAMLAADVDSALAAVLVGGRR